MVSINNVAAVVVDGAVMVLMTAVKMNWGVDGIDSVDEWVTLMLYAVDSADDGDESDVDDGAGGVDGAGKRPWSS